MQEAALVVPPGYHNSADMYKDFRAVFFGDERGKRVFNEIMRWCGIFQSGAAKNDPYAVHVKLGERNIGARIWLAVITEPKERPTETVTRRKSNG